MGHVISEQGVELDPSKVKAITDMPPRYRQTGIEMILRNCKLPKPLLPKPVRCNQASL